MINDSEIRKEVNRCLKPSRPLNDMEWNDLDNEGHVRKRRLLNMADDRLTMTDEGLAAIVRQRRAAYGVQQAVSGPAQLEFVSRERGGKVTGSRIVAICLLAAQDAGEDAEVKAFRAEALDGRLVAYGDIPAWIASQQKRDGPATHYVRVVLPAARHLVDTGDFFGADKPFTVSEVLAANVESLDFPKGGVAECVLVAHGGTLDRLRLLSQRLAEHYTWHPAQAVAFVLSGTVPRVSTLAASVKEGWFPALSRIEMSIDPTLSPVEVAEQYRKLRRQAPGSRYRSLSEKHLSLALFMLSRPEADTYKTSMTAWNRKHPKWKYTAETNFGRDAKIATSRLLESGPPRGASWKLHFGKSDKSR